MRTRTLLVALGGLALAAGVRRLEGGLRRRDRALADFFENAPVGLHLCDPDGTILLANRIELDMLGYQRDEYVGHHIAEFHVDRDVIDDLLERQARRETINACPARMRCRDGSIRHVLISSNALWENGKFVHSRCFTRDITESKDAQDAIARLAAIVASSDDAIIGKDLQGVITSWNNGAERLFGYTADEAIGRSILMLIPPDRQDEEPVILERIRRGQRIDHFETVRRRKDGREIDVSLTVSPIVDLSGRVAGVSKIARDVTERKRAAEALLEASRRKDEFVATLAHELRNPLAPIANGIAILKADGTPEAQRAWAIGVIDRQVSHMARLLDDLLDISRISRNRLELRIGRTSLAAVMESALETSRPLIERQQHTLSLSMPSDPLELDADFVRLTQVFSNLLNNAAKFTPRGGHIWLGAERQGNEVVVSVRDDGIGIAPGLMPRLFQIFAQGEPALGQPSGGVGIGLSLVKGLVELHRGSVVACSAGVGTGSEFVVRLPLAAAAPVGISSPPKSPRPGHADPSADVAEATGRRRILIVDSDRESAAGIAAALRFDGYEVITAVDGREAIRVADAYRPAVIILDVTTPGSNAYEAARHIREEPWGRDVVLLALTRWDAGDDRRRTEEAGFDARLVKPVDRVTLQKVLASSLSA
jgi:PAS domain S-box-containing protein